MSEFSRFMKANKKVKENEKYAATNSICDEKGNPVLWEFRHITSKEDAEIRDNCTLDVPVKGKPNVYRAKLNVNQYIQKMIAASVVVPDLYNAELQDSYGVKTPEDLLMAMVDDPGEYTDLTTFVQKLQGYDTSFSDKVDMAKN